MKIRNLISLTCCILFVPWFYSFAQPAALQKFLILPFQSIGLDSTTQKSAEVLLQMEMARSKQLQLISGETIKGTTCSDISCAMEVGKSAAADKVVFCTLLTLGQKIIIHYYLADINQQQVLLDEQTTASIVEDLDTVISRVAQSIIKSIGINETAEVGAITVHEAQQPLRRASNRYAGFSFGYLYPQYGYDEVNRSFTIDFRTGAEINHYDVGMLIAARKGFAMNVFSSFLFSKKDICPYLGGAFGFHWISHEDPYSSQNQKKKSDGFEITGNLGLKFFHTFDFQVVVNLAYAHCFNDYKDEALIFTIGLLK